MSRAGQQRKRESPCGDSAVVKDGLAAQPELVPDSPVDDSLAELLNVDEALIVGTCRPRRIVRSHQVMFLLQAKWSVRWRPYKPPCRHKVVITTIDRCTRLS